MAPSPTPPLLMACLCAAWCDTCGDYRAVFDACAATLGERVLPAWIDIEDQSDLLGSYDVDNFPTLLLARGDVLAFAGAITPQPETLARMVAGALDGTLIAPPAQACDPALAGLPGRLRAWAERTNRATPPPR